MIKARFEVQFRLIGVFTVRISLPFDQVIHLSRSCVYGVTDNLLNYRAFDCLSLLACSNVTLTTNQKLVNYITH